MAHKDSSWETQSTVLDKTHGSINRRDIHLFHVATQSNGRERNKDGDEWKSACTDKHNRNLPECGLKKSAAREGMLVSLNPRVQGSSAGLYVS